MRVRTTPRPVTNQQVQAALAEIVFDRFLPQGAIGAKRVVGSLDMNYYSFTFGLEIETVTGLTGAFVKIPRTDLRTSDAQILSLNDADRKMAAAEAGSLRMLGEQWKGEDLGVRWVTLLGELPEFNALITKRVFAPDALGALRAADGLRRVLGRGQIAAARDALTRLGTTLGRFHRQTAEPASFTPESLLTKIMDYASEIAKNSQGIRPALIETWLRQANTRTHLGRVATTLKGIDVRNMLLNENGEVTLLDPGPSKRTHAEADLARFAMTLRILHWGKPSFTIFHSPDPRLEAGFMAGYASAAGDPGEVALRVHLVKEILKHWHTALSSLRLREWPKPVAKAVQAVYINAFYERQLSGELARPL